MLPYFFVTIPIALMAVVTPMYRRTPFLWGIAFVVVLVFVGLRHHVGMDWNNYLYMIQRANVSGLWDSFRVSEPGYALLLWVAGQNGWGIYGAYFMGTLIFAAGLFRYAKVTPSPWIALLVAMPYLVIVISMSAARQAVAAGVLLWLTAEWSRATIGMRAALVLLASSFHISAIGFLIFIFLDLRLSIWMKSLGTCIMVAVIIYILEQSGRLATFDANYFSDQKIESGGAFFHVALNSGPALVYFLLGHYRRSHLIPHSFHTHMVITAILLLPLSLIFSTAASRFSIYLFPVSMWFFAAMPMFLSKKQGVTFKVLVSIFFVIILAVWLKFATNAGAHENYRNMLFVPLNELALCCR